MAGRHRGALSTGGDQPLAAKRGGQAGRSTTAWFAAKRPSNGAAMSSEDLAVGWQPKTNGGAMGGGPAAPEYGGQTTAGLPKRVPRTKAYPGSDTPGSGMAAAVPGTGPAAPVGAGAGGPVLAAPLDGTAQQGVTYQEQLPSRRRSPEAVRSRLTGFQLGSREASQTGHTTGSGPHAGEENSR